MRNNLSIHNRAKFTYTYINCTHYYTLFLYLHEQNKFYNIHPPTFALEGAKDNLSKDI